MAAASAFKPRCPSARIVLFTCCSPYHSWAMIDWLIDWLIIVNLIILAFIVFGFRCPGGGEIHS